MKMRIFHDSKTFVDLKLKNPPNKTLDAFDTFMGKFNNSPSVNELKIWINDNFEAAGSELIKYFPDDFKQEPKFLEQIKDENLRKFASELNHIWIELCRKIKDEVKVSKLLIIEFYSTNYEFFHLYFFRNTLSCLQLFTFQVYT